MSRREWVKSPAQSAIRRVFPAVAELLADAKPDLLDNFPFPDTHRREIRSTSPLETAQQGGQATDRGGRHLPQSRGPHPLRRVPGRSQLPRSQSRLAPVDRTNPVSPIIRRLPSARPRRDPASSGQPVPTDGWALRLRQALPLDSDPLPAALAVRPAARSRPSSAASTAHQTIQASAVASSPRPRDEAVPGRRPPHHHGSDRRGGT